MKVAETLAGCASKGRQGGAMALEVRDAAFWGLIWNG